MWDAASGNLVAKWRAHADIVSNAKLSSDGQLLVTSGAILPDTSPRLWRMPHGEPIATLAGHENAVNALAISPDGSVIASASLDQTVRLWDGKNGKALKTLLGHTGPVMYVDFSPDGEYLASASRDQTIRLWELDGDQIAILQGHSDEVCYLQFDSRGRRLASASFDGTARLWDVELCARNRVLRGHANYV